MLKVIGCDCTGHAGSDVMLVAKEAAMRPLRRLMAQLEAPTQPSGNQGSGTRISAKTEVGAARWLAIQNTLH